MSWLASALVAVTVRKREAQRGVELGLLDRLGGIDALRAHNRAFTDEAALPDALGLRDHRQTLLEPLVPRVQVVAPRERNRRRPKERVVEAVNRARGIAEHAVDALAELPELIDLCGRLKVLACTERHLLLADDPRLDGLQLVQEVVHVDHQVADDREICQRLDNYRPGPVVAQKRAARQLRRAVHHYPAPAADTPTAPPPIPQAPTDLTLHLVHRLLLPPPP